METAAEIVESLGGIRRCILMMIYKQGEVRTSELRRECDIPRGSKEHHFGLLKVPADDDEDDGDSGGWGLIEVVGKVESDAGGFPERVWRLTDRGEEFVEEWVINDGDRPENHETRIERLENRVERLEEQLNDKPEAKEIDAETERLQEEIEQLRDELEKSDKELRDDLEEQMRGAYLTLVKNAVLDELQESGDDETRPK